MKSPATLELLDTQCAEYNSIESVRHADEGPMASKTMCPLFSLGHLRVIASLHPQCHQPKKMYTDGRQVQKPIDALHNSKREQQHGEIVVGSFVYKRLEPEVGAQ